MLSAFAENLVTISVKKEELLYKSYVTGRRCPYSGVGEDFLLRRTSPLTKTTVTWKREVKTLQELRNFPI